MVEKKYRLKRRRYQEEHERIVQEANASFIAHFSNWNKKAPKYRKVITQEFKGRSEITLSYQKQTSRPPSGLKEIDLAVVLDCVHTYGLSSRGISAKRINQALGLCNAGKSLAKVAPALRVLHALGLIEYLGGYHPGKRGNRYRLSKKCMLALHLPIPSPGPIHHQGFTHASEKAETSKI